MVNWMAFRTAHCLRLSSSHRLERRAWEVAEAAHNRICSGPSRDTLGGEQPFRP